MPPPEPPADRAALARVQSWLDTIGSLRARFVQTFPDGGEGQGALAFVPPGRLRLDYAPGDRRVLVAASGRITFTDLDAGSVTRMRAAATPFGLLLDGRPLAGAVRVTDLEEPRGALQISLARADDPAAGLLTLTFRDPGPDAPLALARIEAVDAEARRTVLRLFDERTGGAIAPATFVAPPVS